jgi:hypothetical protein
MARLGKHPAPGVQLGAAAQRLAPAHGAGAFARMMHEDDGEGEAPL